MTQELSKNLICIKMGDNIEVWLEKDKFQNILPVLTNKNAPQFIQIEGQIVNRSYIIGIFDAKTMENATRRKNGYWQCKYGYWHAKGEKCAHGDLERYNKV